jgi:hypothetical protein
LVLMLLSDTFVLIPMTRMWGGIEHLIVTALIW